MKIYISADIEGITGVTDWEETDTTNSKSAPYLAQMTAEVAAACEGALQAGATEVWVKDAHASGRNISAAGLPKATRLIRSWSRHPFMMMQELDTSFDAAMLIGYHSRAGLGTSPLAHTLSGQITTIQLNDQYASEFLLSAYTAAFVKVPLVFVSGDQGLCDEIAGHSSHIHTLAVKSGKGASTMSIHPDLAVEQIRSGVARALQSDFSQASLPLPEHFKLEIRFRAHADAFSASFYPGATQKDDHTVLFEADNYFDILRFIHFA